MEVSHGQQGGDTDKGTPNDSQGTAERQSGLCCEPTAGSAGWLRAGLASSPGDGIKLLGCHLSCVTTTGTACCAQGQRQAGFIPAAATCCRSRL